MKKLLVFASITYLLLFEVNPNELNSNKTGANLASQVTNAPSGINMTYYSNSTRSRAFTWRTALTTGDGQVNLVEKTDGITIDNVDFSTGITLYAGSTYDYDGIKCWRAQIEDLNYGSTYYYRVGSPNYGYSEISSFYVNDGLGETRFLHLTDTQSTSVTDYNVVTNVINVAKSTIGEFDGLLHTGDLTQSYYDASAEIKEWGYSLDSMYPLLKNVPITPAAGNHDAPYGLDFFYRHFNSDFDYCWNHTTGFFYSYDLGNVHFTVLNTNDGLTGDTDLDSRQYNWLINDLQKTTCKWKVLLTHKGFYTGGRHCHDADINRLRNQLLPIISEYEVDLVLQGHDHIYTRTEPYLWHKNGREYNPNHIYEARTYKGKTYNYSINHGTYYVIPNNSTGRGDNISPVADSIPDYFHISTSPVDGTTYNNYQPALPMFGSLVINADSLLYESYTVNNGIATLVDYFGIVKD